MAKTIYWHERRCKKKTKNDCEKNFFKDIKLVTTERRRNYLVSEPIYLTKTFFAENVLAKEMKKSRDTCE